MYIREYKGLGQSPEDQRDFEEQRRRYEISKAEHEKQLAPLQLGTLSLNILRRAGLKTTTRVNKSTASLLQSVLERSRILRPYIAAKLGATVIPRNFIHHEFDSVFEHQYVSLESKIIPAGSLEEKELKKIYGFYHPQTRTIHLRPSANIGHALHEAIHKFSSSGFRNLFGHYLDEGVTHYFTNLVLVEQGLTESSAYELQLNCAKVLVYLCGQDRVAKAYFQGNQVLARDIVRLLNINLGDLHKLRKGDILCTKIKGLRRQL
jgi:hypothetical protein